MRILMLSINILHLQIKCTRCENKSERIERILDLTVEISGDIETIEEALQQYTSPEILDGDNRYHCTRSIGLLLLLLILLLLVHKGERLLAVASTQFFSILLVFLFFLFTFAPFHPIVSFLIRCICDPISFRCNSYVKARKRLSILEAPNILTIALKRFQVFLQIIDCR